MADRRAAGAPKGPGRPGGSGKQGGPGKQGGSGKQGGPARGDVDRARRAAYDVVHAVSTRDAYANLTLSALLGERGIRGRDAAFATELSHGTLRWRGSYDRILMRCLDRPLDSLDPEVRDVLRVGAHQLLGMRVASHAAVGTAVDLAQDVAGSGPSKLVNAVLRRVSRDGWEDWMRAVAPPRHRDTVGHLAVRYAHPPWVVRAFRSALGGDEAETERALAADNEPAKVTLVARPGRCEVTELVEAGADAGRWSPYAAVLRGGNPARIPAVAQGRAGIQDEGSQLVAAALARMPLDGPDRFWLDGCAGPGGKAALLAGLAAGVDARLLAVELAPHRAGLVARALHGSAGVSATVCADVTAPAWRDGAFDRVLVDAPCTGLGSLRRRPEARWRRTEEEVADLAALQVRLLESALEAVRPGGLVAYVTCSPHQSETRDVVGGVRRRRDDVALLDARPMLPGVPELGPGPDVQLWPHRHGTDAMYLALLRRAPQ